MHTYSENQRTSKNESVKSKTKKYIVATQDKELRGALRSLPGIPLVYFNNVIMILEPPSYASKDYNKKVGIHEHIYSILLFLYYFFARISSFFLAFSLHLVKVYVL